MIRSQIWQCEVNGHPILSSLHIYHTVIREELKYLIAVKVVSSQKWSSAVDKTRQKNSGFGCSLGLEPLVTGLISSLAVPEPTLGHSASSNLYCSWVAQNCYQYNVPMTVKQQSRKAKSPLSILVLTSHGIQSEFVRKNSAGSISIESGWKDMWLPSSEKTWNCLDLRILEITSEIESWER